VTTLQPPAVPAFTPGTPAGAQLVALLNAGIRDPFTFLLSPPRARLRRAGALNITEGRHQWIPWDTVDEDSAGGWTSGVAGTATTLNGATIVGATTATLTSAAGFATGQIVRIETGAQAEYRQITLAGSVITVAALNLAHASLSSVTVVSSDPSQYIAQAPGWYLATPTISISGTGAAGLVLTPSIAVNGASNTGISGGAGWRGVDIYPPTGVSTQPKVSNTAYEIYCNVGDVVQVDLVFSTESAITAVDTTAGLQCALELVWAGL
jgi:hypothetical protein